MTLSAAGLFAGIGGLELGLSRAGLASAEVLVENWAPAKAVLAHRFPAAELLDDVAAVRSLPSVDVLTAGFPCTDLSQAGRMAGIGGTASGLVAHVFRLLRSAKPTWLVLENVRNMLVLDQGRAMRYLVDELERRGYRWAYRLVDTRSVGLPQRRQRVLLVASRVADPSAVLFSSDAGKPLSGGTSGVHGFYWTEGFTGLGWARDAVPTLKGGSTIGIPSPPAVWVPSAVPGRRLVVPSVRDAEALQGFPRGWTSAADLGRRGGPRWKLVGNAVTVDVSRWLGSCLLAPGGLAFPAVPLAAGSRWPAAAFGSRGQVWSVPVSSWPVRERYRSLARVVDLGVAEPLSWRAVAGFRRRMERSRLRFDPDFRADVYGHEQSWADAEVAA